MVGGKDKFAEGSHFCNLRFAFKRPGATKRCRTCGAVYTCKEVRTGKGGTQLVWLQTKNGKRI